MLEVAQPGLHDEGLLPLLLGEGPKAARRGMEKIVVAEAVHPQLEGLVVARAAARTGAGVEDVVSALRGARRTRGEMHRAISLKTIPRGRGRWHAVRARTCGQVVACRSQLSMHLE